MSSIAFGVSFLVFFFWIRFFTDFFKPAMIQVVFPVTKPIDGRRKDVFLNRSDLHTIGRNWLPPDGDVEKGVDQKWNIGALAGIWFQPPRKVATGKKAKIQWWHRLRSIIFIVAIVVGGGMAIATVLGVIFFASGFLLEQFIG